MPTPIPSTTNRKTYRISHEAEVGMAYSRMSTAVDCQCDQISVRGSAYVHLDQNLARAGSRSIYLHDASGNIARFVIYDGFMCFRDLHDETNRRFLEWETNRLCKSPGSFRWLQTQSLKDGLVELISFSYRLGAGSRHWIFCQSGRA